MLLAATAVLLILLLLRLVFTLFVRSNWSKKSGCVDGVLVVMGSGGHTAEMLRLLGRLPEAQFRRRTFLLADSDAASLSKVQKTQKDFEVCLVPRVRAPLQSWASALLRAPSAFWASVLALRRARPALLLCNGPGTCVPVVLATLLLEFLGLGQGTRIVFVESICRVWSLSVSGRLLYPLLRRHQFLVQWPELALQYPRATYIGQLV